jgi:Flp pilus assembly protein TadG
MSLCRRRPPGSAPDCRRRTRGQALTEFALILPVFLAILLGIMQFGILFWAQVTATSIARDTARFAVTQAKCGTPWTTAEVGTTTLAIQSFGAANATQSGLLGPALTAPEVAVAYQIPTGATCAPQDASKVVTVLITVAHPIPLFVPIMDRLLATSCSSSGCTRTITASVQMRVEPKP